MRILDGANLECDATVVKDRIPEEYVLVADDDGRVVGALVAAPLGAEHVDADEAAAGGAHIEAVAVRLRRRGQGIGTALMEDAIDRWRPITAEFVPGLRGFYEKLEFEMTPEDGRLKGVRR